jgi:hypothetical protein
MYTQLKNIITLGGLSTLVTAATLLISSPLLTTPAFAIPKDGLVGKPNPNSQPSITTLNVTPNNQNSKPSELSMIRLQSIVSQRGNSLQTTTNILKSVNDSQKGIVDNIR